MWRASPGGRSLRLAAVPLRQIGGRDVCVLDKEGVVELGAEPGHGPVRASRPHPLRLVGGIGDDEELVVGEPSRRDEPAIDVDVDIVGDQSGSTGFVLIAFPRFGRRLRLLLRDRAVGEHDMCARPELLETPDELLVAELVQGRVDVIGAGFDLPQQAEELRADLPRQEQPQLVFEIGGDVGLELLQSFSRDPGPGSARRGSGSCTARSRSHG